MMFLKELLAQYPYGAVTSVVCTQRDPQTTWVVGKIYRVIIDDAGNQAIDDGYQEHSDPKRGKFGVHKIVSYKPNINPHMKDGKLPNLITGFNTNIVAVDDCKQERSYEELESLIRVGIDIQDALATNAPDLDRALVDLWFALKEIKQ